MSKRFTHNGIVIIDHLKKDLIYIDGDENLLDLAEYVDRLQHENEQLKQDNDNLIHLLKNQSMIIQELDLKLMDYELKEPIVLRKEDLEVMGKAISYYSHGGYTE